MNRQAKQPTDRTLCVIIWCAFGIYILFSLCLVFPSAYDDYGLASLSAYGDNRQSISGQDFTLPQLFVFLRGYYHNWGGRVVFHGLMILMLKNVWVYRIAQAITVFISFFALHKVAVGERGNAKTVLLCCTLYGAFSFEMFVWGFYWFCASAIFVLPLMFLFIGILLMRCLEDQPKNRAILILGGSFCFLLAGISQEQIAFTLIALMFALCRYDYMDNKRIPLFRIPFLTTSLLGSGFLLLAPGNFMRFQTSENGHSLTANLIRVASNMYEMAARYLQQDNMVFLLLLSSFVFYISYVLHKAGKLNRVIYLAIIPCAVSFLSLPLIYRSGLETYTRFNWIANITVTILFYLHAILFLYVAFMWLRHIKDRYLAVLLLGALFSQIAQPLIGPAVPMRVAIIFYLSFFALFIRAFADLQFAVPREKLLAWVLLPIVMLTSAKMAYTTIGYMRNYSANVYNIKVLQQASEDIKAGMTVEAVEIMSFPSSFGIDIEWMLDDNTYSICEYYDLPHDIVIRIK
jgi:hypothetical protein